MHKLSQYQFYVFLLYDKDDQKKWYVYIRVQWFWTFLSKSHSVRWIWIAIKILRLVYKKLFQNFEQFLPNFTFYTPKKGPSAPNKSQNFFFWNRVSNYPEFCVDLKNVPNNCVKNSLTDFSQKNWFFRDLFFGEIFYSIFLRTFFKSAQNSGFFDTPYDQ